MQGSGQVLLKVETTCPFCPYYAVMTTTRADVSGDMDARVGRLVHTMMWDKRLTQTVVAARLGIQQSALSKKLRGDRGWSTQELVMLAQVLDTTASYLLGETSDPTRPPGDDPDGGGEAGPWQRPTQGYLSMRRLLQIAA